MNIKPSGAREAPRSLKIPPHPPRILPRYKRGLRGELKSPFNKGGFRGIFYEPE